MTDITGTSLIIATVAATTYWKYRTLQAFRMGVLANLTSLRTDMNIGLKGLRFGISDKLDTIQQDMHTLHPSNRQQPPQ